MANNTYTHTLADVKAKYGEKVVETATSFVVNAYGKYQPNISFVLDKDFGGDPLKYRSDAPTRDMVAGLGLGFGTGESAIDVLFGDFWLSKSGKPHFRAKSPQTATHFIVCARWGAGQGGSRTRGSWGAPNGAAYFRRASSNGGGTGLDYYVLPVGYYLVVRDEELDGDAVVTPDFLARAKAVRVSFAMFDKAAADKATVEAQAKADAEAASRAAKVGFIPRLEAAQTRLEVLESSNPGTSYPNLKLDEAYFLFHEFKLYTEENVRHVEHNVGYWEEQAGEKLRKQMARAEFQPQFEAFVPRVDNLGLTLSFSNEEVSWRDGVYRIDYPYSQEGLESFKADLTRKEEEKAKKERKEAASAAKAKAEAEAAELGLPQNVRIWRRMGGVTNRGSGWVIRPDGTKREADNNPGQGELAWNQVLPGELVLQYHQADRYDIAHCEVVYRPDQVTQAQLVAAKQIEEDMGASENAFGLDDRLGKLIERRIAAIDEVMATLPESLRPEDDWDYQALVSTNGIPVGDGESWVNHDEPFDERCEGREAQVVYVTPAADGELVALTYYKWGYWNVNLLWRETGTSPVATSAPEETASAELTDMKTALQRLQNRFGKNR